MNANLITMTLDHQLVLHVSIGAIHVQDQMRINVLIAQLMNLDLMIIIDVSACKDIMISL